MPIALNDQQMFELMQHSPMLDAVENHLSPLLRHALVDAQQRTGAAYAAGVWTNEKGEERTTTATIAPPTTEEMKEILGQVYLQLDERKKSVRELMDKMHLTPSYLRKNWLEKVADTVQEWFR